MAINATATAEKCHLLISGLQKDNIKTENAWIRNSENGKLLGIKFYCKITSGVS